MKKLLILLPFIIGGCEKSNLRNENLQQKSTDSIFTVDRVSVQSIAMKNLIIIFMVLILATSCKKEAEYTYQMGIKNLIDRPIEVRVFPNKQHKVFYENPVNSSYSNLEFTIEANQYGKLFSTNKADFIPSQSLSEILDSLTIKINFQSTVTIRFKPNYFEHYNTNIFSDNSNWTNETVEWVEKRDIRKTHIVEYIHKFEIKQDNLRK